MCTFEKKNPLNSLILVQIGHELNIFRYDLPIVSHNPGSFIVVDEIFIISMHFHVLIQSA